jgi:uncharacterized protein (TIGR03435 family)
MWITRYLLLGVTLALIQGSASQLSGQNSAVPVDQSASGKLKVEEFEVATIKPAKVDESCSLLFRMFPAGRIQIINITVKELVRMAYDLNYWQIQGGAAWMDKDCYDIEAKPPEPDDGSPKYDVRHDNVSLEDPHLRAMLQTLLGDRFGLKIHTVVKNEAVGVLERDNNRELSLTPSKQPAGSSNRAGIGLGPNGVRLLNATLPELAAYLGGNLLHEPVVDKTGLVGSYDFQSKTSLTPEDQQNLTADSIPGIFLQAIKEMGLKLTKSTGPVTTLVIDQAAHPSPN